MNQFNHVMIDLETMGIGENAVIAAICATAFDITTGKRNRIFYQKIDITSCMALGMQVDGPTLYWWLNQSEQARQELLTDTQTILVAIARLSEWMGYISEFQVWGNGASFDLPKLKNAFVKCGYNVPWHHYNERDVRTMVMLRPEVKENMPFLGTKHTALADCRFQIDVVCEIYSLVNPAPIS